MKFSLDSELDFEAKTRDAALLKLALHFMSLMESRPTIIIPNQPPIDAFGFMIKSMPSLDEPTTDGYIDVDIHGDFEPPVMLQ